MSILNKIAARLLGAFVAAVPERNPTAGSETPGRLWRYTITDDDGSPYLTRVLFPRVPVLGFRPMLHKFHRPDGDQSLHNHPWRWALSIVLAGSYVEERLEPDESRLAGHEAREVRRVSWWNYLTDEDFHRITELRGEVYTLFVIGPRTQGWGFLGKDGAVTEWQEYLRARRGLLGVEPATGEALDLIGAMLGVYRHAARMHVAQESDDAYRARLVAVFREK